MGRDDTLRLASALAAVKLAIHLPLSGRYGFGGDELYFIECGRHLDFGYVDHPPLVPWIARASEALFGDHLWAFRLSAAVAGACAVFLTVMLARRLGAGSFAQLLAGVAVLLAPAYLRVQSSFCIPAFEPLYWTAGAYLIALMLERDRPKLWLAVGLVAGIGLLNKLTMLVWGVGLLAGIVATDRRQLTRPWIWAGALVALVLFSPELVWQARHGWPTMVFIREIGRDQLDYSPRWLFLVGQVLYMNPFSLPLTIAGLWFFFSRAGSRYRIFGYMFLSALGVLLITGAKTHYFLPAYPPVFAGGAIAIERAIQRAVARWAITGSIGVSGLVLAAACVPMFPIEKVDAALDATFGGLARAAHFTADLHDEFGWPEQLEAVAGVQRALPEDERTSVTVLTHDYAQAANVNIFGPALGLPEAVSGHMTYALWGPARAQGKVVIAYGFPPGQLERWFEDVQEAGTIDHPLGNPWQRNVRIYVCRRPKGSIAAHWAELRRFWFRP